jgi:hypothetical protein
MCVYPRFSAQFDLRSVDIVASLFDWVIQVIQLVLARGPRVHKSTAPFLDKLRRKVLGHVLPTQNVYEFVPGKDYRLFLNTALLSL